MKPMLEDYMLEELETRLELTAMSSEAELEAGWTPPPPPPGSSVNWG